MKITGKLKVFIGDSEVPWEMAGPGIRRKVMAWDERVMMVKVEFEKGAVGTLHQHPHSQISHVQSGVFEIEIGGETKILSPGDAFYIPSNVLHGAVCLEPGILIDIFSPMRQDFVKQTS